LKVSIVDAKWSQDPSGNTIGTGFGNLYGTGAPRGFAYTTPCNSGIQQARSRVEKWIGPQSGLEVLTVFESAAGMRKSCEFEVTMQNNLFTMRDGQTVRADSQESISK
jgi:hypothetical protein